MRLTPPNPTCMSCQRALGVVLTHSLNGKQKQWRCLPCAERINRVEKKAPLDGGKDHGTKKKVGFPTCRL